MVLNLSSLVNFGFTAGWQQVKQTSYFLRDTSGAKLRRMIKQATIQKVAHSPIVRLTGVHVRTPSTPAVFSPHGRRPIV